jgi:hypothetical protein
VQKGCIRYARPATFTSLNADVATRALHKGDETKLDFFFKLVARGVRLEFSDEVKINEM